jgi:hypothetical protein
MIELTINEMQMEYIQAFLPESKIPDAVRALREIKHPCGLHEARDAIFEIIGRPNDKKAKIVIVKEICLSEASTSFYGKEYTLDRVGHLTIKDGKKQIKLKTGELLDVIAFLRKKLD